MSTLLEQYACAVKQFDDRVQKIADDQWNLPTPCSEWNVTQLVAHVVDEQRRVSHVLSGRVADGSPEFGDDPLQGGAKRAWDAASADALAALNAVGALDQHVHTASGEMSARDYLWQMTVNLTIHAWDVARAIGCDDRLSPELIRRICLATEQNLDEMAESGLFGRPVIVPAGADLQARTLAMFGRRS